MLSWHVQQHDSYMPSPLDLIVAALLEKKLGSMLSCSAATCSCLPVASDLLPAASTQLLLEPLEPQRLLF